MFLVDFGVFLLLLMLFFVSWGKKERRAFAFCVDCGSSVWSHRALIFYCPNESIFIPEQKVGTGYISMALFYLGLYGVYWFIWRPEWIS